MFSRTASGGRLAHTAEPSSSGGAIYCPNSDTYGDNTGCTQVPGHKRDVFRFAEGAGQCHCEGAGYYLGKVMVTGSLLEERKLHTCCQEGKEGGGGSGELQGGHPPFRHWKDYGANLGSRFQAHEE